MKYRIRSLVFVSLSCFAVTGFAQEFAFDRDDMPDKAPEYSPYVDRYHPQRVFFGDTHHHSSFSVDSGMFGNTLGPAAAYRFARGEEVLTAHGLRARLIRPLDFLVVADHSENLGLAPMIAESHPELLKVEWGRKVHELVKSGNSREAFQMWITAVTSNKDPIKNPKVLQTVWDREIAFADQYNEPGRFTALIGFEWTSIATMQAPGNLHRVVIFKDGAYKAKQVLPFSTYNSYDPEDLWDYMANYEATTGGSVLAIAHNGNVSNGLMFPIKRLNGKPVDRKYAEMRNRFEPLYEVTQIKGDGEAHPFLSPNDEFADYGTWDKSDIAGFKPKEDWMLQYEYARSALQIGMQFEQKLGQLDTTIFGNGLLSTRDRDSQRKRGDGTRPRSCPWAENHCSIPPVRTEPTARSSVISRITWSACRMAKLD